MFHQFSQSIIVVLCTNRVVYVEKKLYLLLSSRHWTSLVQSSYILLWYEIFSNLEQGSWSALQQTTWIALVPYCNNISRLAQYWQIYIFFNQTLFYVHMYIVSTTCSHKRKFLTAWSIRLVLKRVGYTLKYTKNMLTIYLNVNKQLL